jgi:CRP-like cAMP-binding protein
MNVREHPEGGLILRQERQEQPLFIIADGRATLLTSDKEGQETIVVTMGPGEVFGGISLFQPIRQSDSTEDDDLVVKAATSCIILEIEHGDLSALTKREPKFSDSLLDEYYKRRADITLARVPLFSYLKPVERHKIADHLVPDNFKKDDTIITEGEIGDTMYVIKSGEVGIYTTLMEDESVSVIKAAQERLQLATLKSGDFFGEQALITKEPRNATIIAHTDVELLKFSKKDLAVVVRQYPRVGTLLGKYHQQRIAETLESLKSIW